MLRDYQQIDLEAIREKFREGNKRVIFVASVGYGKMAMLTYIAHASSDNGKKVYLIFHSKRLCNQAEEWLMRWGARFGSIRAGKSNIDADAPVQVCMVQTLARRTIAAPDIMIMDETHRAASKTHKGMVERWPDARLIGFTATPFRLSGECLISDELFQDIVIGRQPKWLTDNGYLTPVRVFSTPSRIDMSSVSTVGGDYNDHEVMELLTDSDQKIMVGDCIAEYRRYCEGQPALAQCMTIKHAQDTARLFSDAGYAAEAVHGEMSDGEVQDALDRLKSGATKVICYAQLLGEGVDIPSVTALFFLKATKSLVTWVQACGRVQRKADNKEFAYVFDHFGNINNTFYGHKMGHPSEDRDILGIIADSLKVKRNGKSVVEPVYVRCSKCDRAHSSKLHLCPGCGHDRRQAERVEKEQQKIQADLQEYERNQYLALKRKEIATLSSYEDYQAYAKLKGYKAGWAYHAWKKSWKSKRV